jgi:pilus assembly protein CpaB
MRRRIVMLAVAFVLAILSAVAVVAYARTADRRAVEGKKGTWVLLATARIPTGTTGAQIRSKRLVRQVLMPAQAVPSGALSKLDSTLDAKALNAELQPDQMLLSRQFETGIKPTVKPAPTFKVPADRLAVSVELGIAPQVAGNVKRGDKVTVFVTVPRVESEVRPQKTWVVLPQATVLSVGESAVPKGSPIVIQPSGAAALVPTVMPSPTSTDAVQLERYVVTLAVTATQAEELVNGYNRGLLHLGLLGASASVTAAPTVIESGPAG